MLQKYVSIVAALALVSCSTGTPLRGNSIQDDQETITKDSEIVLDTVSTENTIKDEGIKIFSTGDYSMSPMVTDTLFEGNTFKVVSVCEYSTCTIQFLNSTGEPLFCPEEVHCSYILDGSYHMNEKISAPSEEFFVYGVHDGVAKDAVHDMASIKLYSLSTGEISTLINFPKGTRASIGKWSPDYDRLVITAINYEDEEAFPHDSLIYVLNFQDGHFVSVDPYDIEALEFVYNTGFSAQWMDDDTLSYVGPSTAPNYVSAFMLHLDTGKIEYLSSSKSMD